MAQSSTRFSGLAVHHETMAGADVAHNHGAEVTSLGPMGMRPCDLDPRVRQRPSTATPLVLVEEAGPGGSWLWRELSHTGDDGGVVAPSRMPQTAADRVPTDRRDAGQRARLVRAGALPAVDVPTVADDASRDLSRAREETSSERKDATCRLHACWLRHALRSGGRAHGHPAPRRWRAAVVGPTPAPHLVCQAAVRAVTAHTARLQRLAPARHAHVNAWRWPPVVAALQALRGGPCPGAVTMVAAMGDLRRCDTPSALLQWLGVLPSASAAGARRQQGALTTAGNPQARRARGEGAWAARDPAQGRRPLPRRRDNPPQSSQDLRWKAQGRRCPRDRHLGARGTPAHGVTVASARALAGCMGAMATEVPVIPSDADGSSWHACRSIVPRGKVPPCSGRDAAPVGGHPRRREEARGGSSRRDRGRHPTEARQVGPNPRIAAGSTVASDWRRLFPCTTGKKTA
jgi:transposase